MRNLPRYGPVHLAFAWKDKPTAARINVLDDPPGAARLQLGRREETVARARVEGAGPGVTYGSIKITIQRRKVDADGNDVIDPVTGEPELEQDAVETIVQPFEFIVRPNPSGGTP